MSSYFRLNWSKSLLMAVLAVTVILVAPVAKAVTYYDKNNGDSVEAPDLSGEYEGVGEFRISEDVNKNLSATDYWSYKEPKLLHVEPVAHFKLRLQLVGTEYSGNLEIAYAGGKKLTTHEFTTRVYHAQNVPPDSTIHVQFDAGEENVRGSLDLFYRSRHQYGDFENISLNYTFVRDDKVYNATAKLPVNTRVERSQPPLSLSNWNPGLVGGAGLVAAGLVAIVAAAGLVGYLRRETPNVSQEAEPSTDDWPSGTTTEHDPEGAIIKRMPDGTVATRYTDGTVHTKYPDDETITEYPDGTVKTSRPDGTNITDLPNGTKEIINPDGTTATITADKVVGTIIDRDGFRYTVGTDNTVSIHGEIETADGERITVTGDQSAVTASWKDGSTAKFDADGNMTKAHLESPEGITLDMTRDPAAEEGTVRIKDGKGNSVSIKSDGSAEFSDQEGFKVSTQADGTTSVTTPEGAKWTAKPDGTGAVEAPNGTKAIMNKDGSWTVDEPGGKSTIYSPEQLKAMADNSGLGGRGVGGLNKQVREA